MSRGKKIGIIIISAVLVIVVIPISASIAYQHDLKENHPEEYAKLESKWEQDRLKEMEQTTEQPTAEQIEKNRFAMNAALKNHEVPTSFENFEPATVQTGSLGAERLKYRPFWLVGDEWDEREWLGKISKSQECVDAVSMIDDALAGERDMMYRAWVRDCVTMP